MRQEDQDRLIELLRELGRDQKTGGIPPLIFEALLPICPQVNFEFVVCRRGATRGVEVLLVKRPDTVPSYPGHWHCPGAFIRTGDKPDDVSERIRTGKMGDATITNIQFLNFQMYTDPTRGEATIIRLVHLVEIEGEPPVGEFFEIFPTPNLPDPLVWEQPMLLQAATMFGFRAP